MKFFTYNWWRGQQQLDVSDPLPTYRHHLNSIRNRLLDDQLLIEEQISIHDARVHSLDLNLISSSLALELDGDDGRGGCRRFTIQFAGVCRYRSLTNGDEGLPGPAGYGDLGYWEVDIVGDRYEHRILFSSGIEIWVEYESMQVAFEDKG